MLLPDIREPFENYAISCLIVNNLPFAVRQHTTTSVYAFTFWIWDRLRKCKWLVCCIENSEIAQNAR